MHDGVMVSKGMDSELIADQARAVGAYLGQCCLFGRPVRPEPQSEPELVLA